MPGVSRLIYLELISTGEIRPGGAASPAVLSRDKVKTVYSSSMKIFSPIILFLSGCLLPICLSTNANSRKARDIAFHFDYFKFPAFLHKTVQILDDIYEAWNYLLENPDDDITSALFRNKEHKLIGRFLEISSKLDNIEEEVKQAADATVITILQAFPKIIKLELTLHELTLIISQVDFADDQMRQYLMLGFENITSEETLIPIPSPKYELLANDNVSLIYESNYRDEEISNRIMKRDTQWLIERFTLEDFATWATGHSYNSLQSLLRRMNDLIKPKDSQTVFEMINEISQEMQANLCNLRQSPHQTLYNLYNTLAVTELKGNTLLQFSYMLLKLYKKGNFSTEAEIAQSNYEKYTKQKIEAISSALSKADRSIYKCDPSQYVEGITYTKLTRLLQGYIENEVNLNPYGTCRENCQYYSYTEYNGCFKNQFCANQPPCRGKVLECRYVDSDMNICTSSSPERRYDWVEYENGKTLGNKGVCQKRNFFKVDSWWRYLFWHCSYCLCLCDDVNQGSDRYFNLRDVTSDIENNKIVTGLRIIKQNQIIHLQIQQGVLGPMGVVNKTSLSWKPADNYTIDDDNVENNVDYHTMSWLERSIDTDEVYGPPEHVVTGLRFRKIGTHLNLEVRVTPINFTSGEVFNAEHSYWLGNDNTDASLGNPRTEIQLTNPDIPIRNGPHSLNSKHDQYIQFQPTSFDTDAGQNTVPYLDSQVLVSQGFPLSGIGLIHRGKFGSGGFISPKLISYDFTPHLSSTKTT